MKIIDYRILSEYDKDNLVMFVQACLRSGWIPLGGISVARINPGPGIYSVEELVLYTQAMVKYEE